MKTFTLDEAQALLPLVTSLLDRANEARVEAAAVDFELNELSRRIHLNGGMRIDVTEIARKRTAMNTHTERMKELVSEIDEIGALVKDLEKGLLDFPAKLDEDIVLLCWKHGEPAIEFWHTTEDGFAGRKPIDDRFRRKSNNRIN
jgi:hypothetical protein